MAALPAPPLALRVLALPALALLLASCGGGDGDTTFRSASPTLAATATPIAPLASATAQPSTPALTPPPFAEAPCQDPYLAGAPYEPTPGAPIRIVPEGSPAPLASYDPLPFVHDPALDSLVRASLGDQIDHFAVVVKNLADGSGVVLDPGREFYAASLYKTWVMLEAYHQQKAGLLDWDERYLVSGYYEEFKLNPGELEACEEVTVLEALDRAMRRSDNVAAILLLDRVGAGNANLTLRSLGLGNSGFTADESLPTTAGDMALLLEAIAMRQAVSDDASEEMLALLISESIVNRLPALLPIGTQVAHKTGNWEDATHDAGIVFSPVVTYIIVVLTDYGYYEDGATPIAELSLAVYDYYN